jgi:hypothetical protein
MKMIRAARFATKVARLWALHQTQQSQKASKKMFATGFITGAVFMGGFIYQHRLKELFE